jgi:hypothetical protein
MRLTDIIWPCKHCSKEFRLFSDDNGDDTTICWNYCPYCGQRNDIWIRFWLSHRDPNIPIGLSPEEGMLREKRYSRKKP